MFNGSRKFACFLYLKMQRITDICSLHDPRSFSLTFQKWYFSQTFPWPHKFSDFNQFSLTCRNPVSCRWNWCQVQAIFFSRCPSNIVHTDTVKADYMHWSTWLQMRPLTSQQIKQRMLHTVHQYKLCQFHWPGQHTRAQFSAGCRISSWAAESVYFRKISRNFAEVGKQAAISMIVGMMT